MFYDDKINEISGPVSEEFTQIRKINIVLKAVGLNVVIISIEQLFMTAPVIFIKIYESIFKEKINGANYFATKFDEHEMNMNSLIRKLKLRFSSRLPDFIRGRSIVDGDENSIYCILGLFYETIENVANREALSSAYNNNSDDGAMPKNIPERHKGLKKSSEKKNFVISSNLASDGPVKDYYDNVRNNFVPAEMKMLMDRVNQLEKKLIKEKMSGSNPASPRVEVTEVSNPNTPIHKKRHKTKKLIGANNQVDEGGYGPNTTEAILGEVHDNMEDNGSGSGVHAASNDMIFNGRVSAEHKGGHTKHKPVVKRPNSAPMTRRPQSASKFRRNIPAASELDSQQYHGGGRDPNSSRQPVVHQTRRDRDRDRADGEEENIADRHTVPKKKKNISYDDEQLYTYDTVSGRKILIAEMESLKEKRRKVLDQANENWQHRDDRLNVAGDTKSAFPGRRTENSVKEFVTKQKLYREPIIVDPHIIYSKPKTYNSYKLLQNLDMIISVEHCINCEFHNTSLRHIPQEYVTHADTVLRLLAQGVHEYSSCVRLGVIRFPAHITPKSRDTDANSRIGAFEVQIAYRNEKGLLTTEVLHSKLFSRRWPSKSVIDKRLKGFLSQSNVHVYQPTSDGESYHESGHEGLCPYPIGAVQWSDILLSDPAWKYQLPTPPGKTDGAKVATPDSPLKRLQKLQIESSASDNKSEDEGKSKHDVSSSNPDHIMGNDDSNDRGADKGVFPLIQWAFDARKLLIISKFKVGQTVRVSQISNAYEGVEQYSLLGVVKGIFRSHSEEMTEILLVKLKYHPDEVEVLSSNCFALDEDWEDQLRRSVVGNGSRMPEPLKFILSYGLDHGISNWKAQSPEDKCKDIPMSHSQKIYLARTSFFKQIRELVWNAFHEASQNNSDLLYDIVNAQLAYSEEVMNWVFSRTQGTMLVCLQDLEIEAYPNYKMNSIINSDKKKVEEKNRLVEEVIQQKDLSHEYKKVEEDSLDITPTSQIVINAIHDVVEGQHYKQSASNGTSPRKNVTPVGTREVSPRDLRAMADVVKSLRLQLQETCLKIAPSNEEYSVHEDTGVISSPYSKGLDNLLAYFEANGDNEVDMVELLKLLKAFHMSDFSDDQIIQIWSSLDLNGDMRITHLEFLKFLHHSDTVNQVSATGQQHELCEIWMSLRTQLDKNLTIASSDNEVIMIEQALLAKGKLNYLIGQHIVSATGFFDCLQQFRCDDKVVSHEDLITLMIVFDAKVEYTDDNDTAGKIVHSSSHITDMNKYYISIDNFCSWLFPVDRVKVMKRVARFLQSYFSNYNEDSIHDVSDLIRVIGDGDKGVIHSVRFLEFANKIGLPVNAIETRAVFRYMSKGNVKEVTAELFKLGLQKSTIFINKYEDSTAHTAHTANAVTNAIGSVNVKSTGNLYEDDFDGAEEGDDTANHTDVPEDVNYENNSSAVVSSYHLQFCLLEIQSLLFEAFPQMKQIVIDVILLNENFTMNVDVKAGKLGVDKLSVSLEEHDFALSSNAFESNSSLIITLKTTASEIIGQSFLPIKDFLKCSFDTILPMELMMNTTGDNYVYSKEDNNDIKLLLYAKLKNGNSVLDVKGMSGNDLAKHILKPLESFHFEDYDISLNDGLLSSLPDGLEDD